MTRLSVWGTQLGGLLRKSTYPGTATPTQLKMYATDLRGEPRERLGPRPDLASSVVKIFQHHDDGLVPVHL